MLMPFLWKDRRGSLVNKSIQFIEYLETPRHINYDEQGRHNRDKETTTQRSRLHDYRETSEERERGDVQRHRFLYPTVKTTWHFVIRAMIGYKGCEIDS
ncbi:hypothetical protein TNCV_2599861 [Trichonephila clavipes]|nr:hypothetical protein TNCV_2599861 [Trichonephila clavipes]